MAKLNGVQTVDMVGGEVTKISYEGAEYTKVEGDVQVGDIALYEGDNGSHATYGNYYEVIEGDVFSKTVVNERGNQHSSIIDDSVIFRKSSEQPTLTDRVGELETRVSALEGAEEVIEGDPQVGDKIRIVDADSPFGTYKNGDIFTVDKVDRDNEVDVKEHGTFIFREEYEIIERPSKPALQVGDYAKVVDDNNLYNDHSIKMDEIVEIIKDDDSSVPYRMKSVTSGVTLWAKSKHIVKATDAEVAEAKRKLAEKEEAEKWAAINRKPNEYKVGDIVGYKFDGEKCKVIEIGKDGLARVKTVRHGICAEKDDIELITPVEHRFDR